MFEVLAMIRDLILYFLKQGCYDGLGQLRKVRAALRDLKITVSVDERDEEQLERTGLVQVARHIRIGTVDTFQGQEAKIVIISLVRNSGSFEEGSIGFLKSPNRINHTMSRAKHGLYLLGNASNLGKNGTWRMILNEMENEDQIGYEIPIICPRHPTTRQLVSKPGELPTLAPEGGCLRPCEFRLACGHVCPSMCHADQDNHRRMKCNQPCLRLSCPRMHPCPLLCSDNCGDCKFPIYDVKLPCGHTAKVVPCYMLENLNAVNCTAQVLKRLPDCEPSCTMACGNDPASFTCKEVCGGLTTCCSRLCTSRCHECQKVTKEKISGISNHSCNPKCPQVCRQRCGHRECDKPCWEPCPPCMEPCEWRYPHHSCPVVCGSICSCLPCDYPCKQKLTCGHECPSVCGEPCEQQTCISWLPDEEKVDIVDFIMQRKLAEIDPRSEDIAERLIKLACGHIFTAPPIDYQTPPSCPTCRGPLTSLRYGRNVASTMSSTLDKIIPQIEDISAKLENAKDEARKISSEPPEKGPGNVDRLIEHRRTQFGKESEPLPPEIIHQGAMTTIHGFSGEESRIWNKIVREIVKLYRKIAEVARTRGPHVQTYGAALAKLYRLELAAITSDPERACDKPEQLAMEEATRNWTTPAQSRHPLRYTLAEIAHSRIKGLDTVSRDEDVKMHVHLWRSYISFIYESCICDAEKALAIAQKSTTSRLAAQAVVYVIRGKLELFRFEILTERTLSVRDSLLDNTSREQLSAKARQEAVVTAARVRLLEATYMHSRPAADMGELKAERAWFNRNCHERGGKCMEEYNRLAKHLLTESGYEDIVKSFGFCKWLIEDGHRETITASHCSSPETLL
ncbi:hypothetical protein BJV74DRAFT_872502 [Russula compacta]|nr:hypothetical protein BJV74DRAFT_872502 [Russula compacta]